MHSLWQQGTNGGAVGSSSVPPATMEHTVFPPVLDPETLPAEEFIELVRQECEAGGVTVTVAALKALYDKGSLVKVPRGANGELTSVGSIPHANDECTPCAYWYKGVCTRAVTCCHCHLVHERQKSKRLRPSKQTRQRMRARINAQNEAAAGNGDETLGLAEGDFACYEEREIGREPGQGHDLEECERKMTILSL